MTIRDLKNLSEDDARTLIESVIWPDGPVCPHCGNCDPKRMTRITPNPAKRVRAGLVQCKECRKQMLSWLHEQGQGSRGDKAEVRAYAERSFGILPSAEAIAEEEAEAKAIAERKVGPVAVDHLRKRPAKFNIGARVLTQGGTVWEVVARYWSHSWKCPVYDLEQTDSAIVCFAVRESVLIAVPDRLGE